MAGTVLGVSADGTTTLAHAVGTRSDLPVDLYVVITAGALAVVVSFVALAALWRTPKLRGDAAGAPLPAGLQRVLESAPLLWALRLVALAVALFVTAVALFGPSEGSFNLAPYALYVTFWVGLIPASLLLGPVWRVVSPLRTLHRLLVPLTGPAPAAGRLGDVGLYPAAAGILAFTWLELVYPDRAVPQTVGVVIVLYAVVQLVAALWYGEEWFARGEAFEVWSTLLGRLSPWGRRTDGRLVVRNPLDGLDGTPVLPGTAAFTVVLIGSTGFDGVTRASWWQEAFPLSGADVLVPTLGLFGVIALVAALYYGATALAGRTSRTPGAPEVFAHSLVPIAAGYAVAHYFSLLVFEGQLTWILASNPFGLDGVDVFGTYRNEVDLNVVSPDTISAVQVTAIILGHVLGVVLAHDRAVKTATAALAAPAAPEPGGGGVATKVRTAPAAAHTTARTSQYPLLVVMVAITVGGLALLLG